MTEQAAAVADISFWPIVSRFLHASESEMAFTYSYALAVGIKLHLSCMSIRPRISYTYVCMYWANARSHDAG